MKNNNKYFCDLLYLANIHNNKKAAALIGVTERTIRRYKKGDTKPPIAIYRYLALLAGNLEQIDSDFKGWKIKKGHLISDNGEMFNRSRLEHIRTEFSMISSQKTENRKLREEIKKLKEYLPSAEVIELIS